MLQLQLRSYCMKLEEGSNNLYLWLLFSSNEFEIMKIIESRTGLKTRKFVFKKLLKGEIDEYTPGSHFVNVAGPWAIWIIISDQFVIEGEHTSY